jgi:hypothetical protein
MIQLNIVAYEIGKLEPEFWLDLELPEAPAVGGHISILRPGAQQPHGEDRLLSRNPCRMQPGGRRLSWRQLAVSVGQRKSVASRSKNDKSSVSPQLKANSAGFMIWSVRPICQVVAPPGEPDAAGGLNA